MRSKYTVGKVLKRIVQARKDTDEKKTDSTKKEWNLVVGLRRENGVVEWKGNTDEMYKKAKRRKYGD